MLKCILPVTAQKKNKSILFINSGQIGDLIVSSTLFENEQALLANYKRIVFLFRDDYKELFFNYAGCIEIKYYNYFKYKFNPFYKFRLLKGLRDVNFKYCFNLSAARGILNDEMAILIGAGETFALNSDWKHLKKLFGGKMDSFYSEIIGNTVFNEYEKHFFVLKHLLINPSICFNSVTNNFLFNLKASNPIIDKMVVDKREIIAIAPFSSNTTRDWPLEKLISLIALLVKDNYRIVILCSKKQSSKLNGIENVDNQVIILNGILQLNEIPLFLTQTKVFLGLDSGITHIAIRLGIPTVALIGGGMFGKFLPPPFSCDFNKFLYESCEYFNCEWRCRYKEKNCINNVSVEVVYEALLFLSNKSISKFPKN